MRRCPEARDFRPLHFNIAVNQIIIEYAAARQKFAVLIEAVKRLFKTGAYRRHLLQGRVHTGFCLLLRLDGFCSAPHRVRPSIRRRMPDMGWPAGPESAFQSGAPAHWIHRESGWMRNGCALSTRA